MTSFATQPASALPETPEKASEPPHCKARRSAPADSGGSAGGGHRGHPPSDERCRALDLLLVPPLDTEERMRHVVERVVAALHESTHVGVRVRAGAVVGREHRAHVGVHHESGEHPQHVVEVVRAAGAAAFGMRHRDHAIDCGGSLVRGPFRDAAHEPVGPRRGGEHHDEVAGSHAPLPRPAEAFERRPGIGTPDLLAGRERGFVQLAGLDGVREVRGRRQLEVDVAFRQRGQDLLVADVLTRAEGTGRDAERESPRREARSPGGFGARTNR